MTKRILKVTKFVQMRIIKKKDLSGVGFEPTQSYDYESLNLTP